MLSNQKAREAGIERVRDIVMENGQCISYNQINRNFPNINNFIDYNTLCQAIKSEWRLILSSAENFGSQGQSLIVSLLNQDKIVKYLYDLCKRHSG